jgi:hypothetical protein
VNEKEIKFTTYVGMLAAVLAGSVFGLILIIGGYLLGWGPGGSTDGPFWRILLVGIPSFILGSVIGLLAVWFLSKKLIT